MLEDMGLSCQHAMLPVLAAAVFFLFSALTMPHPYEGLMMLDIEDEVLGKMSSFPPDFEHSPIVLNSALKAATSHFNISSGVDVSHDGRFLFLLDRAGYLHIATLPDTHTTFFAPPHPSSSTGARLHTNLSYIGPGRPLNFVVTKDSRLLVADSLKGLVEVDVSALLGADGVSVNRGVAPMKILANQAPDGSPITHVHDLDVCPSTGKVYFSSATLQPVPQGADGLQDIMKAFSLNTLRGDASGRIFSYDPFTHEVQLVVEGAWFVTGVALSEDCRYIYYAVSGMFRLMRRSLETGVVEVVLEKLPGFPHGLSRGVGGNLWVSIIAPVSPYVFALPYPRVRMFLSYFTKFLHLLARRQGLVVEISPEGKVLRSLGDPKGEKVAGVFSIRQVHSTLYLGNLFKEHISSYELGEMRKG